MNEDAKAMGTEGIVATPAQQKVALDDKTYNGDPVQVRLAAYQPSNNKEAEANAFNKNKEWRSFLTDPSRNLNQNAPSSYRTFRQLESMWHKPEYASIIDAHGSDMAVGGQLLSDYVGWGKVSPVDRTIIGISAARRGMQIGEARTKVAELIHDGASQAEVDKAKAELAELEEYAKSNTRPFDSDTANALASFGVSFARVVPEMVVTTAALGALLPTGGATAGAAASGAARTAMVLGNLLSKGKTASNIIRGLKAGRAVSRNAKYVEAASDIATAGIKGVAEAGIVYNDTYRVTMGDLYKRIKDENPGMSDEQVYDLADSYAEVESVMESLPALVGLGARAATTAELGTIVQSVISKMPKDQIRRAAFMRAFQQGANKEVGKRIAAGWTKDTIVDTLTEVAQTAADNAALQVADMDGDGSTAWSSTLERLAGFVSDPLNEKYADELNTLVSTLPAAALFGGIAPGIAFTKHKISKSNVGTRLSDTFNNFRFGAQMRAYTQDSMDKGIAPEAIKEQIRGMASRGDAPESVYFDRDAVQQLVDTDPEFRRAMDRLGVIKQLGESQGNGGVVEVDFADYNELVNGEKSGVLYQKVKDMVSFRLDSMTMSQLNEWIASTQMQNKKEIQKAIADEKSVYNRTLKEFLDDPMFAAMTEEQRKANATLMQLVANRASQSLAQPMTAEEWFEKNVLLTTGEREDYSKSPSGALQQAVSEKTLDNVKQGANVISETQGVQNGQTQSTTAVGQIRRAIRQGNDRNVWTDKGTSSQATGRPEGVRILSYTPEAIKALNKEGYSTPAYTIYDNPAQGAQEFLSAMQSAVAELGELAASVDVKSLEDYQGMKALILSEDKKTGCAITKDGDIVSLFSSSKERGRAVSMLLLAVQNGGNKLDCFDIYLPRLYSKVGFRAVARNHWNEEYKPDGWNKDLFGGYNNGEPDVVFMVYDPNYSAQYQPGDGMLIEGENAYDAGMAAQDEALKQIDAESKIQQAQDNLQNVRNAVFQRQYQKNKDVIAGWFDVIDGKYVVGLTKNWNATTFSHETFHLYSRALQDQYNAGTMSSYWKAQTEKMFSSVDAKPNKNGKIKLTKNQEELLAERFTTYLLKNKIENPELNSIFALLRDAFEKTYKQFDMTEHNPDAKTKEAFAVIFGAQDVAAAEQRALGLLEIEKPEGVSQEAYDHYMSFLLESRAKASHDMIKTFYRVEKYKTSKEYAKAYDEEYTRNLKAVEKESTFQIKALAKQLGTEDIQALLLAYNSTHAESLITEDDVMAALNDTEEATAVAEARTAEYMNELVKEKFNVQDDQTLISKDAKNAALAKAFLMESLMNEGKDWSDFNNEYTDLLQMVENQIQKMPLSKLRNTRRWNQLESVYAQQYQMYSALGNKDKMAKVRRQQAQVVLIQNKMFEMDNRVERFLDKFPKKLRNAQPQSQNTMTAESWDLLQSLMEQYGFKISDRRRSAEPFNIKLDNWLSNIEDSQYCPISNIRYFMPETVKGHEGSFNSMTVRQFEVLEHVATAINSIASHEYYLITEDEKMRYDSLAAMTAERLKEKGIKPYDENDTWVRKHLGVLSNIVNPEPILKALFPEEVHRTLIRPFFTSAANAETSYNKWNDQWNNMIKKVNLTNNKKKYSTGHVLSYNNVANLLLAMGNEHSYENWRLFLKVDEAQAETIIAEALAEQPELANFANSYWSMMAETTDVMNTSYRKRYNKLFVKKQPRAFKIGEYEFTGGYVPETKLVSELPDDAGWESILMGELSNEKLINDKPDGKDLQSIVDNTRSRLRLFSRWGYVAPEFNNFVRFVQREDVGAAIGSRAQNYIRGWLRDYHTPAGDSAGLMHALMSATSTTVLGLRLPQALLQLSGVIPAMGLLGRGGVRYVTAALGRTLVNGGVHQVASAMNKSDYMKARYSDPVKTLFGVSKAEMQISKTIGKFQKVAMSMISYMDAIVSNATWDASYRMAIDNGLTHKEAVEKADQNVRLSQTDAMTVSRSRAMKSDWARIITPFSTYMMGMQSVVRGRIAEREFYGAATFALSYITISTMFEAMLKEIPMPWEPEDDENYLEKIIKRWYNDSVSTAGSTLYPIAGIGSYATESFAEGLEKVINPDEPALIDMYGMGSLSALNYAKQYPDALRYGMIGIFNGDEDAQRKAIANFVGWFSAGGKRMVKDLMED